MLDFCVNLWFDVELWTACVFVVMVFCCLFCLYYAGFVVLLFCCVVICLFWFLVVVLHWIYLFAIEWFSSWFGFVAVGDLLWLTMVGGI